MNDREKWEQHRAQISKASGLILHVLTDLPAHSKAFEELMKAVEHIAIADTTTPDYSKDPSL